VRWSDDGATESVPPWNSPAAGGITAMCTNPLRPLLPPWCYGTFRFSFSFHGVLKKRPFSACSIAGVCQRSTSSFSLFF
jgi:hypothetical protein